MDPNERLTGIAQMTPAGMGAPPIDAASGMMNPGAVTGEMTLNEMGMDSTAEMGMGPEMVAAQQGGQDPEMMGAIPAEEGATSGEEPVLLAQAVMERAQGDPNAALALLDAAGELILQQTGGGDPMMTQEQPMMANMGGPLYREDGGTMSDTDLLRQMIMSGLQGQEGRTMSNMDNSGRTMSDRDMSGRTMSDVDIVQLLDDIRMAQGN